MNHLKTIILHSNIQMFISAMPKTSRSNNWVYEFKDTTKNVWENIYVYLQCLFRFLDSSKMT